MSSPKILAYVKFVYSTKNGNKTPKYTEVKRWGNYLPMEQLKGKDGLVSMHLLEKLKEGDNVPSMWLQAKGSLNFTGLKEFFNDGKLSGYAYGYPYDKSTYSSKKKTNPFYNYRQDGFLFIINSGDTSTDPTPQTIELIVLEGAKVLISSYCKQLSMGGFNDELKALREHATDCTAL